jgi:NADH-quinone oxidoreductase subunit L
MEAVYAQYAWLVPLFPLIAFLVLLAIGRTANRSGPVIGVIATLASFVMALLVLFEQTAEGGMAYVWNDLEWIRAGDFVLAMGYEVNPLNALMLVIVTFVSLLVNLYSMGYMKDDPRITVFFSYVALFTFSMLALVISENIVQLYIFWELVGVCSFLLIGFWYTKPEAKAAAKKAFIVTRIGDVGLFIGILLLVWNMPGHAIDFTNIGNAFASGDISGGLATLIAILIFIGAVGKSGQFPLHTWLPDAMEGPTPISALIHAATMVAAGVYLVARTYPVFEASESAMQVVAIVGAFTAIFAALIALTQTDIKRVLAYSTVSQLGYMMLALGIGAYAAGIFHLFTHAFFKALLFLAAGSVIHVLHEQNIFKMGGLMGKMRITGWTFVIGALALAGIFPFAGFWSKDAILAEAYASHPVLFWVALITAFLTAFYMARLFFLVFTGQSRAESSEAGHAHESPLVMTLPMILLAIFSIGAGFFNIPGSDRLAAWLTGEAPEHHASVLVMVLSNVFALAGILLGWLMYGKRTIPQDWLSARATWLYRLSYRKFYIDEIYDYVIVRPLRVFGYFLHLFDEFIVDGIVRLTANITLAIGRAGTRLQNGQLQTYGLVSMLGLVILAVAFVGWRFVINAG